MAEFSEAVREAENKLGFVASDGVPVPLPRKPLRNPRWVYAVVVTDEPMDEEWPSYFVALPRVGDYVTAKSGRRLEVMAVVHKSDIENKPFIEIELGVHKYTDVSPTSGGGGGDGYL